MFDCSKCEKKFKRPQDLKNHEKTHLPLSCSDCGNEFARKHEERNKNNTPSRCPECDKKFKQKNPPICEFYKAGHCMFGSKGQNKLGKCYKKHPEPCEKFISEGCKDNKCTYMHPAPVCSFFLKNKCERKHCKFTHKRKAQKDEIQAQTHGPEKSEKNEKPHDEKKDPSDAQHVNNDTKMETFLEEWASKFTKMLDQMDNRIQATINNNRIQQSPFPQMVMQQNPLLATQQPMQRLI